MLALVLVLVFFIYISISIISISISSSSSSIKLYWHDVKIFYILPKRFKFSLVQITLVV